MTDDAKSFFPLTVRAGRRYLLCACGRSGKRPLCDGSHAGSAALPVFYTATTTGQIEVEIPASEPVQAK